MGTEREKASTCAVRQEIGSEFWAVPTAADNGLFPEQTAWFLSGRSALSHIIAALQAQRPVRRVALPAWCCDSMILPFVQAGIPIHFYPVYVENGRLVQDVSGLEAGDLLFRMDYFGYQAGENTVAFDGPVIHDLTHGLFSTPPSAADYCFGSLRKWAGFYTGGYAFGCSAQPQGTAETYVALRRQAMEQKQAYILGNTQSKDYLSLYGEAEELLEGYPMAAADPADVQRARTLDVAWMRQRRRDNAACLLEQLADVALFPELGERDCPLFVPILVPSQQRDALRRHLIQNEMYCPVHWPLTEHHTIDAKTKQLYESELSLVCDQRYTPEDMQRLAQAIKKFWKG